MSILAIVLMPLTNLSAAESTANRLTYLHESGPFKVHRGFPKLTTPQWIGEPGVEAVVVLAIDDLREPTKYEKVLRPLLTRLKQIDGRAPVSIMCNTNDVQHPLFTGWLREGLSLEVHSMTHPCPFLANGSFDSPAANYHNGVDLLFQIPGNQPVAFRMPCCDSMNSPSPRFYSEIFSQVSKQGHFLGIDSSIMLLLTPNDPQLPKELVVDPDGREKFRKYFPAQTNAITRLGLSGFANWIEDYPYPYVVDNVCWEFPCIVPSDWEAQNTHRPTNNLTVADWKAAVDATVIKQGVFTMIFHPHGWINPEQMVDLIDYAAKKHGPKVKFLNFREAYDRLNQFLLAGKPLRTASGLDSMVRLVDLDNDGFLDVYDGANSRVWQPQTKSWLKTAVPGGSRKPAQNATARYSGVEFGVFTNARTAVLYHPKETALENYPPAAAALVPMIPTSGLEIDGQPVWTAEGGKDLGVRLRDLDHDGVCEVIVSNPKQSAVFKWSPATQRWTNFGFGLPAGTMIVDDQGRDAGLRFVDVSGDGYDHVLFSNPERYALYLFTSKANDRLGWKIGWTDEVVASTRSAQANAIPMISRGGAHPDNGVWFRNQTMWVQNEDTANLPDHVERRTFKQLLQAGQPQPLSPEKSRAAIRVRPGFTVELVASEPLVQDPIAFEWGADGKLWVVEMGDYPRGIDEQGKPGGRVKYLEDTDGDGLYDKATVFLEGVPFPTGLYPWGRGVIVSSAPDIFYAEDTDGDGKADVRKKLFTGFVEGNQQHRLNGFDYGLDDWLYGANGDSGGQVIPVSTSPSLKPVNLRQHDFRIQPDKILFEAIAGQTQYGRHRDDWGNWFGNNNPNWLWHYFLPEHYLIRNPSLAVKTTRQMLANYPDSGRCYPASKTLQRFNDFFAANHVTSGNSPTPYRDELFGPEFAGSVFVSEPVHNLVHREVLEPDGVTFKSHRAADEKESEFLASSDNWFRPTMLKTGPDGALYIADMYRLVIEHPEWIPQDIQRRFDLRAGFDKGRIYRVYPIGVKPRAIPRLDGLEPAALVAALDSPSGWQRDTAQRLLLHAQKTPPLAELAKALESARPLTRIHALHILDVLGALSPELLASRLSDSSAAVREHAVLISEAFLRRLSKSPLLDKVFALSKDPDIRVRYQLALSLGESRDRRAAQALLEIADHDPGDANIQNAVLSSATAHAVTMLAILQTGRHASAARLEAALKKTAELGGSVIPMNLRETTVAADPVARAERAKVVKQYEAVAGIKGDTRKGLALYQQNCSICHRLKGQGNELGPDLATVAGKPVDTLLTAILDPNQAVESRYLAFTVVASDGREA
ncbi:MAG TPA: PVC-type heme-binding CxxCH protein, partial [Verrucomicrobiae bacterium]